MAQALLFSSTASKAENTYISNNNMAIQSQIKKGRSRHALVNIDALIRSKFFKHQTQEFSNNAHYKDL